MLTHRPAYLAGVMLILAGCSTELLIESQYDDEPELDATAPGFDARTPFDTGVLPDARRPIDASVDAARDASADAARDAANPADATGPGCAALPTRGVASLLTNGCGSRQPTLHCVGQITLNNALDRFARSCGLPLAGRPADLGFLLGADGCATQFRFEQEFILGMISSCIQAQLEQVRFDCRSAQCGVIHLR